MPIATRPVMRTWTVPAAGKNTIWEILNDAEAVWLGYISLRAARNNAGDIYWQDSQGNTGGFLGAGEAALVGDEYGSSQMKDFIFRGTAGDKLYLTIGVSCG